MMRAGEAPRVAWACALLFFVFAGWYVLRPLRDAMGVAAGARDLPHLFLATLALALLVAPAVSALVSRVPRRRFVPIAYRFLAATLIAFWIALRGEAPPAWAARAFFVWSSVFNLVAVALAWGLLADVFTRREGVRLFAVIGAGGTVGAMIGSLVTATLVARTGAAGTLLVAACLLEAAAQCVPRVAAGAREPDAPCAAGGTFEWLRRVARAPLVLAISAYIALFTVTSTALYLEQARIVSAGVTTTAERAALFARMDLAVNALALFLQLFVVARVLRKVGLAVALATLPVLTLVAFLGMHLAPFVGVLVVCQVARRSVDFALSRPAREVLFTVAPREDRYKAKSLIDTFVYRGGDAVGAWGFDALGGPAAIAVMVGLCAAWAAVAWAAGTWSARTRAP